MVVFPSLKSQRLHILVESSESLPLASQLAKQAVSHSSKSMHSLSQEAYASKKKSKKQPTKTVKTTKKKRFQRPKWLRSAGENNLPRIEKAHSFTSDPDFADDERESQVNHNTDKSTSPNTDSTVLASPVSPLLTGLDHVSPSEAQFSLEVWKLLSVRSLLRYLFISIARNGNPDTLYHYLPTDTAKNAIDKKKHHATAHQKLRAQKSSLLKLGAHNVAVIARLISKIWGSIKELSVRLRDAAKRKATFTTKSDGEEILQGDNSTIDSPVVAPCTENRTDDAITVGPQTCADLSDSKGSSKQVSFCFAPSQTEDEEPQAYTTWRAEQNRHSDEIIRQIDDIIVNIAEIDPLNESPQLNFAGFQTSPEISPIDLNLSAQGKNEHEREAPEVSEEPLSTGFDGIPTLPQSITEKDSSQTQPINTDFFRRSLGNEEPRMTELDNPDIPVAEGEPKVAESLKFVFSNVVTVSGLLKTDTASDELQDPIFENKQQNTQAHYEFIHNQMPSIVEGSDSRHVLASIHLKPETSDSVGFKQVFDSVGSAEDKLRQNQVSTPLLTISEIDEREQYIDAPLRVKFLEAITEEEDDDLPVKPAVGVSEPEGDPPYFTEAESKIFNGPKPEAGSIESPQTINSDLPKGDANPSTPITSNSDPVHPHKMFNLSSVSAIGFSPDCAAFEGMSKRPLEMWFHSYNPCTKTEKSWADYDSDSDDSLYQEFFASYGNTSLAKGGESEKTNISEAFRTCKTENRASSAIIPASSSGVPTAAFANTQSLPLETRREFQAQIGWNQSSEEDILPSVTFISSPSASAKDSLAGSAQSIPVSALTSTSPEEIQVAVEKRPEQNTTDFLAKDCKYSATTEEIPVLTTGNSDSSGYLQFEAQFTQSESVKSGFSVDKQAIEAQKLHFETPGNFPCEETQHDAYPQEVSKTSLSLRKTEALLLQLEENNHPIVEAKSENLFALNEASCHETYPSSIFKDTKENIVDSTDKALLRGPEEAGLSFKPFLDFSAEWNQLRDQSSTKIEGSNTNPMVSALFDGYLRVFLYLTVEVHSCNEKVITFLKDILSNVHVGEELISTGRETLNEISIILKEAENSTNINFIPWEDQIRNLESVSTDLDAKFDKFQANLSLLEKEFNPRAAEMIDLISNLAMIRNEVLKSYYRFYQLNGAHVIFCLYNVQQNTTVSEYEAKSNWHVCIDMDEFKQALDHNMEHLATTSASLGSLTGEIRKYLSNAQKMLPPTGKSHTEYVDTKSKKASNGISTELPESGKGEESNSEYAPGKKFKRKRARNKPKKSKRSKSRR